MIAQGLGTVVEVVHHPDLGGCGITFVKTSTHHLTIYSQTRSRQPLVGDSASRRSGDVIAFFGGSSSIDCRVVRYTPKSIIAKRAQEQANPGSLWRANVGVFATQLAAGIFGAMLAIDLLAVLRANPAAPPLMSVDLMMLNLVLCFGAFKAAANNAAVWRNLEFDQWLGIQKIERSLPTLSA